MPLPPFETDGDLPEGLHQADLPEFFRRFGSGGYAMIQNDTAFQATQYRLAQFEKTVCGLRRELSPQAFADCVGYILEIQRMREEIDKYLLRPLKVSPSATDAAT